MSQSIENIHEYVNDKFTPGATQTGQCMEDDNCKAYMADLLHLHFVRMGRCNSFEQVLEVLAQNVMLMRPEGRREPGCTVTSTSVSVCW